ncbi:hypothetical protein [Serratia fonticola]|uniref:hypothetical protein n=1 Tax=Serratia fonticola TaxID=47917 RepID=UPI003AAC91A6
MDSTLLGALIGAGATLTAVIVAARINYIATQKQENKRILNQKKEELYQAVLEIERVMYLYLTCINNAFYKLPFSIIEIDEKRDRAFTKIEMISTIYFFDLDITKAMDAIAEYEQSDVYYIRPEQFKGEVSAKELTIAASNYHKIEQEMVGLKVAIHKL